MKQFAVLAALVTGLTLGAPSYSATPPPGAKELGYTRTLVDDDLNLDSVSSTGSDSSSKWYAGEPGHSHAQNLAQREMLSTVRGQLAIPFGAAIISATPKSTEGATPLLDASKGFYVEFTMHLSGNNADHFYGLYLLPVEHNASKGDHFRGDPAGYQRWTEIDVSESGYGPGSLATVISWWGHYPQYGKKVLNSYGHEAKLDFTKEHRYGLSYEPSKNELVWYIDDVQSWKATASTLTKHFHYYMVIDAATHGAYKPYTLYMRNVSVWGK